jgi:hypothetical protein
MGISIPIIFARRSAPLLAEGNNGKGTNLNTISRYEI